MVLTQIAIGHQRREQHGQRQRNGYDEHAEIKQQLKEHTRPQVFPDDIIEVLEQRMGKQNKLHHRESEQERPGKGLQN